MATDASWRLDAPPVVIAPFGRPRSRRPRSRTGQATGKNKIATDLRAPLTSCLAPITRTT